MASIAVRIVLCACGAFCGLLAAFHFSDRVGVFVTTHIVRRVMPRPEAFAAAAAASRVPWRPVTGPRTAVHDTLRARGYALLERNLLEGERFGVHYRTYKPAQTKYGPHQWLWDSCFHMMINAHHGADGAAHAWRDWESLFSMQNAATGFVPEMIYWGDDANQKGIPGWLFGYSDARYTDITQMPMVMFPLRDMQLAAPQADPDAERATVDSAVRYLSFWRAHRDPDGDGLVSIVHPWESGLDASPLYDDAHVAQWLVDADVRGLSTGRNVTTAHLRDALHRWYEDRSRARTAAAAALRSATAAQRRAVQYVPAGTAQFVADASTANAPGVADATNDLATHRRRADAGARPLAAEELYPRFIVLLYRYKHRAGWDMQRILSPDASQRPGTFDVEDIAVNAVLARGFDLAAQMYPAGSAARAAMEEAYAASRRAIVEKAWDARRQQFVSYAHVPIGQPRRLAEVSLTRRTVQGLFPLLLPDLPEGMVRALVTSLRSVDDFNCVPGVATVAPVPTVACHESDVFDPNDSSLMWRGPVWPTTVWFIVEGLLTQLVDRPARSDTPSLDAPLAAECEAALGDVLRRWVRMHAASGFSEYYDPLDGSPQGQPGLGMGLALLPWLELARVGATDNCGGVYPDTELGRIQCARARLLDRIFSRPGFAA